MDETKSKKYPHTVWLDGETLRKGHHEPILAPAALLDKQTGTLLKWGKPTW